MLTNEELEKIVQPYTMACGDQVRQYIPLARRIEEEGIPGDMVECGVWNGGLGAVLAHFAANSKFNRKVWLFDSFEGLPTPTKEDLPQPNGVTAESCVGSCKGSVDAVKEVLQKVGADMAKVNIHAGWFRDTLPTVAVPQIAMLSLDSDWYESERVCLEKFYDAIVPGGFIYFDDFYLWPGCQKAALEFFHKQGKQPIYNNLSDHSAWVQKGAK